MVTLLEEAKIILKKSKKSMTAKQISSEIEKRGKIILRTKTPVSSLSARLYLDITNNKNTKFTVKEKLSNVYRKEKYYSLKS